MIEPEVKSEAAAAPRRGPSLLSFKSGGWVVLLAVFFTLAAAAVVLWPAMRLGWKQAIGDGRNIESYGFDLSDLQAPRETITAAGVPKDAVQAISERQVETMSQADLKAFHDRTHRNLLVTSDRVIGIIVNGEARAYPLRILAFHEVCNDVLGGVPVAVTYSPICDSAVVFERTIGGSVRELRNSGLMINSAPLYYDRQPGAVGESLWGQLQFKAIAGPAAKAGLTLTRIDHAQTTWGKWRDANPASRALVGLPDRRDGKIYDKEPFATYFKDDDLKFPISPVWKHPRLPKKLPIVATEESGKWIVRPADEAVTPGKGVQAFVFAWYAVHPEADYSALEK